MSKIWSCRGPTYTISLDNLRGRIDKNVHLRLVGLNIVHWNFWNKISKSLNCLKLPKCLKFTRNRAKSILDRETRQSWPYRMHYQGLYDCNYRVVTVLAMFLTNLHKIVLHKMLSLHRKPCSIIKNHKY